MILPNCRPFPARRAAIPVFTHINLRCVLTDVVRQARDNPIIRLSMTIRDHIEAGADIPVVTLAESLPVTYPAQAGIVGGGMGTAAAIAVDEINQNATPG